MVSPAASGPSLAPVETAPAGHARPAGGAARSARGSPSVLRGGHTPAVPRLWRRYATPTPVSTLTVFPSASVTSVVLAPSVT